MSLKEEGKKYRDSMLSRNIYTQAKPYKAQSVGNIPILSDAIPSWSSIANLANLVVSRTPLTDVAQKKLAEQFALRLAFENNNIISEIGTDIINSLGGKLPNPRPRKDYKITLRDDGFLDRIDPKFITEDPLSDVFSNEGLIAKTGSFQNEQRSKQQKNYYSIRDRVTIAPNPNSVHYWLEYRLKASNYFSDLVFKKESAEDIQKSQTIYDEKMASEGIGSIISHPQKHNILIKEGEYGDANVNKAKDGACGSDYKIRDTEQINEQVLLGTDTIIWGKTTISEIEGKFGAKRGLLRMTAEMIQSKDKNLKTMDQTEICYEIDGKVVYKANPCRGWTRENYYGKTSNTLIRNKGNDRTSSVLYNSFIPKIHPNGIDDNMNRYMFAIEHLGWTKQDLIEKNIPDCEWGPNYGRLLWFPPYIENISESLQSNWNEVNFVGRGEPMMIHSGTSKRTGSISFFLIMDYPEFMDYSQREQLSSLFMCEQPENALINNPFTSLGTPNGNTGLPNKNSTTPNTIITPPSPNPKDSPTPEKSFLKLDISPANYYFENDKYQFDSEYEYYSDPANTTNNRYSLNSIILGYGANNTDSSPSKQIPNIGQEGNIYNSVQKLIDAPEQNGKLNRYPYTISFTGNASQLYIGLVTQPSNYNVYLAFRRAFSFAQYFIIESGLQLSNFKLDLSKSSISSETKRVLGVLYPNLDLNLSTASFEPNNMFPYGISAFEGRNKYYFELEDEFFFQENVFGKEGFSVVISAKGSTASNTGETNAGYNELRPKQERNVLIEFDYNEALAKDDAQKDNEQKDSASKSTGQDNQINQKGTQPVEDAKQKANLPLGITVPSDTDKCQTDRFKNEIIDQIVDRTGFKKYRSFAPAFHSQTPEDYHRRLTFLQQLSRAGNSVSAINAENSVFGRSPLAVIRVGDFFHTKIAISSITLQHGSGDLIWDLNMEGMGVQPMWTKVDIQFTFVGGESLKAPIDRLQNAVSFNYYANSTYYNKGIYENAVKQEETQIEIDRNRIKAIDERK